MAKGSSKFGKYKERKVREALRNPINVLKSLSEKSQEKTYKYRRLYRNSMARINRIIESMRNQNYQPKPARRVYQEENRQ